jgi:hypothetical protein
MAAHGHDSTVLEQSPTLSCQENQGYLVHLYSTDLFFALNLTSIPVQTMNTMSLSRQEAEMWMNKKRTYLMTLPHPKAVLPFTNDPTYDLNVVNLVPNQLNGTEKLIQE